ADVLFRGSSAVRMRTLRPASARQTPVLSPITPAPTTTASTALAIMPSSYWAADLAPRILAPRILSVFQATCKRSPRRDLLNEAAAQLTGPMTYERSWRTPRFPRPEAVPRW